MIYKTKDRVTRTPLYTRGDPGCSGRVSSSCSTSGACRVPVLKFNSKVIERDKFDTLILINNTLAISTSNFY